MFFGARDNYQLVDHRIYEPSSDSIILIAENTPNFALLNTKDYELLKNNPPDFVKSSLHNDEHAQLVKKLIASELLESKKHISNANIDKDDIKQYPNRIVIRMTNACNFDCRYCYSHANNQQEKSVVNFDMVCETIKALKKVHKTIGINFHGGEPLIEFELVKKIVYFAEKEFGSKNNLSLYLQTNGSLLANIAKLNFFKEYGFKIVLSLDGLNEDSNIYRDVKNNTSLLNIFENLINHDPKYITENCYITSVIRADNILQLPRFIEWLEIKNIKRINFSFLETKDKTSFLDHLLIGSSAVNDLLSNLLASIRNNKVHYLDISSITNRLSSLTHRSRYTVNNPFLFNTIMFDHDSKLKVCSMTFSEQLTFATNSILAITDDPLYKKILLMISNAKSHYCKSCPFFGLCMSHSMSGIAFKNGTINPPKEETYYPNQNECELTKIVFKRVFDELTSSDETMPLVNYYKNIHNQRLIK